ncbi:MAG: ACT domain-containing protein [Gammaproteobacteria bacterium]|nr:ACT domain-containing protein [Gammaproteobacteria bacterium]
MKSNKGMRYFILTFIGDDHPGFVQSIAKVIADGEGNWLESRMSQLEGKFAGLARIGVSEDKAEQLKLALFSLAENRFTLSMEDVDESATGDLQKYQLSILGPDRAGIVHEVTSTLARYQINLLEMSSNVAAAAMTGIPMFSAEATVEVTDQVDIAAIDNQLSDIAAELGVDILFTEIKGS